MVLPLHSREIIGLIRPDIDIHTLGLSTIANLLEDCNYKVVIADAKLARAVATVSKLNNSYLLIRWIEENHITRLGFSYRLDPKDAQLHFGKVYHLLKNANLMKNEGGPINQVYFAGLPDACNRIKHEYHNEIPVFIGDEEMSETLEKFGVPKYKIPNKILLGSIYDDERKKFAKNLIYSGKYLDRLPISRSGYSSFGTFNDTVMDRIVFNRKNNLPPLTRVHVGPYNSNYKEAIVEFHHWLKLFHFF